MRSEDIVVIVTAVLIAIGILGICLMDDWIKKYKRYVRNKYNKKGKRH